MRIHESQDIRKIQRAICAFQLNLRGLTVLTEAGSGVYGLTPLIAAMGGAKKVFILVKNSRYGKASDLRSSVLRLARKLKLEEKIHFLHARNASEIAHADIVTNLGFVRPINEAFIRRLKATAAVPLMWETWEFRQEDLDLAACRKKQIPVLGTNEHHPKLRTFDYLGDVVLKMMHECGFKQKKCNVTLLGRGIFFQKVYDRLRQAKMRVQTIEVNSSGGFSKNTVVAALKKNQLLVVADHETRSELIGPCGVLHPSELKFTQSDLCLIHLSGGVDQRQLKKNGIRFYPRVLAKPGFMSVSTAYVDSKPLIDLHTAGLKVGEALTRARLSGLSRWESEKKVLRELSLAQGFVGYHDQKNRDDG